MWTRKHRFNEQHESNNSVSSRTMHRSVLNRSNLMNMQQKLEKN